MSKTTRIERAVRSLTRAGRRALVAQERYDYWLSFGTNSARARARAAEANREKALADLDRAEANAEEAFIPREHRFMRKNPHAVALGRKGGSATSERKTASSRRNGIKGGRPKKIKTSP